MTVAPACEMVRGAPGCLPYLRPAGNTRASQLVEERHELIDEVVLRKRTARIVVGVRLVAIEQREILRRNTLLVGENGRGGQHVLTSQRRAEGEDAKRGGQVVPMRRADVEDGLRRVGVPLRHGP